MTLLLITLTSTSLTIGAWYILATVGTFLTVTAAIAFIGKRQGRAKRKPRKGG